MGGINLGVKNRNFGSDSYQETTRGSEWGGGLGNTIY